MNLFCIGLSHHTANVETREQFAGNATAESIARHAGCAEALLLTTCNRVEVYGVSDKRISTDEIARCLMRRNEIAIRTITRLHFIVTRTNKCVQHLFRVASGLDSMVVGESEILGQAKKAYESAQHIGSSRSVFASFISTRVSSGKTGAHAHRHYARLGVGRFRRG